MATKLLDPCRHVARGVVLRSVDGQTTVLPRSEIEGLTAVPRSIVTEGILKDDCE